jgi:hypothetical protein
MLIQQCFAYGGCKPQRSAPHVRIFVDDLAKQVQVHGSPWPFLELIGAKNAISIADVDRFYRKTRKATLQTRDDLSGAKREKKSSQKSVQEPTEFSPKQVQGSHVRRERIS